MAATAASPNGAQVLPPELLRGLFSDFARAEQGCDNERLRGYPGSSFIMAFGLEHEQRRRWQETAIGRILPVV
eukprot:3584786-Alexandrium_andersonii.AAC.1